jgi:4-hydroxy-2-oxoheptanedioate aldolase
MIRRVIEVGRAVGTPTGIHVMDAATARERAEQGMQFIAVGSELRFMIQQAQVTLQQLSPDRETADVVKY